MVTEPLLDLLQPAPQPTPPPLFHNAKGPLLGDVLDAEGSANSAEQAPGCCNLFMPTAQEVPNRGEGSASHKIQDQIGERCQMPYIPHGTPVTIETVWVLHLCPKQTHSAHRATSALLPLKGAGPLEKGKGREMPFT